MLLQNLLPSICFYNDSLLWVSGVTVIPSFLRFSASSFFKTATSAFDFSICREKLSILWQKQISKNDFAQFGKLFYLCHLLSRIMWPFWCMDFIKSETKKDINEAFWWLNESFIRLIVFLSIVSIRIRKVE